MVGLLIGEEETLMRQRCAQAARAFLDLTSALRTHFDDETLLYALISASSNLAGQIGRLNEYEHLLQGVLSTLPALREIYKEATLEAARPAGRA